MASNDMNLSERRPSRGKDALWELDLLSFLRRRSIETVLREPDIVANFGFGDYPIACKKVYSEKGVETQMRKGVQQTDAPEIDGQVLLRDVPASLKQGDVVQVLIEESDAHDLFGVIA